MNRNLIYIQEEREREKRGLKIETYKKDKDRQTLRKTNLDRNRENKRTEEGQRDRQTETT